MDETQPTPGVWGTPAPAEEIARARMLARSACPRRYCWWWWQSLRFDWDTPLAKGCEYPTERDVPGCSFRKTPCSRRDPASEDDHYEPREPHLLSDGFSWDAFCSPALVARYLTGKDIPVAHCFLAGDRFYYWDSEAGELVLVMLDDEGVGAHAFWDHLRLIGSVFDTVEAVRAEVERRGLAGAKLG
jgi:hypothetical protein